MNSDPIASTNTLQRWLDRLHRTDVPTADAVNDLLAHSLGRFRALCRRVMRPTDRLRRYEESGDVVQTALAKLHARLAADPPATVREYLAVAGTEIRRSVVDLARKHFGPHGDGARQVPLGPPGGGGDGPAADARDGGPSPLAEAWLVDVMDRVQRLPDEQRLVFDLIWTQELTQEEAAAASGLTRQTVGRRWLAALLALREYVGDRSLV